MMKNENGFVLFLVLVIVCVMTLVIISLTTRTTQASYLATKRVATVRTLPLAESAALEGYWHLASNPSYRLSGEKHWNDGWYQYTIIDPTPLIVDDDISLEVLGEGFVDREQRRIRLVLTRSDLNSDFIIESWREDN